MNKNPKGPQVAKVCITNDYRCEALTRDFRGEWYCEDGGRTGYNDVLVPKKCPYDETIDYKEPPREGTA